MTNNSLPLFDELFLINTDLTILFLHSWLQREIFMRPKCEWR